MQRHNLEHYNPPPDTGLDVIYADDCLLVLDKPAACCRCRDAARTRPTA
ncbi:Uncharacterised protein [Chromobacterium violaceum]|uniref:Ribosomal large subunit pseudouridine synthase A n=1 Tax=Chromobacterium violaceum TaxID=536 RepID=A0A447TJD1_CHRVL|nr:Uncharacterised protein [Chromobacterium violaceum]